VHWDECLFHLIWLSGVGGATFELGLKALRESRSPYKHFVWMHLSGGRSGGCFQYMRGERAKECRAMNIK